MNTIQQWLEENPLIEHEVNQGSPEWHALRAEHDGSSEAAAMLGLDKKTSRSELLRMKATGVYKEFSDWVQKNILDYGHEVEASARLIIEQRLGVKLYPVTCSRGRQIASCDGMNMAGTVGWEHKQWNKKLVEFVRSGELPDTHMPQVQQQLLVTGAEKWIFTVSDGTDENIASMEIFPDATWFERIIAGWGQFNKEKENYQYVEAIPASVATPTRDLPALSIQVQGSINLIDNLAVFGAQLKTFVAEIDMNPTDDQGFANAEAAVKTLKAAQDALEQAEASALAQTSSIDEMRKTVKLYADTARTTRLALEKMVKARKESIRVEIVQAAKESLSAHYKALEAEIKPIVLMQPIPAFAEAIKSKRTIASLHDAVDNLLRNAKMEADAVAKDIRAKLTWCKETSSGFGFLFNDLQAIIYKPMDDFQLVVTTRIEAHKQAEIAKEEAQRQRIQVEADARAKAEAHRLIDEAASKAKAEQDAIRAHIGAEERAKAQAEAAKLREVERAERERLDAAATEEKRKQVQLAEQIKPFAKTPAMASAKDISRPPTYTSQHVIGVLMAELNLSHGQVRDLIISIAEELRVAA